jgi:hypothetical protein
VAELDVDVPMNDIGHVDDFIDDGIVIVPDINNNKNRGVQALLLVINTIFWPVDANEIILQEDCLSVEKLAEGYQMY